MPNTLGVYFGPQVICLVETKGKSVVTFVKIPRSTLQQSGLEEKVPEQVKLTTILGDELKKNNIQAREAYVSLSGKDLIVRTFELPILPASELANAVNFEAKKYIPFKVEELVSAYQIILDRKNRKQLVLFVGIKKDVLDTYITPFKEMGIKVNNFEYGPFSVLRFLQLAGQGSRGVAGVITLDPIEDDEVNFSVVENGFPVFSRDISLGNEQSAGASPGTVSEGAVDKLKSELRISLDYYHRKFPNKKLLNMFLVADENYRYDLESYMKELEIPAKVVDVYKYIGKAQLFSLSLIKGYGSALTRQVRTGIKLDLFAPKPKVKATALSLSSSREGSPSLLSGIRLDVRAVLLGLVVYGATYGYGLSRITPVKNAISGVIAVRPQVKSASGDAKVEALINTQNQLKDKIKSVDRFINQQIYLTPLMEAVARCIPEDVWITDFNVQKPDASRIDITFNGLVYAEESNKEIDLVNTFVSQLKANTVFGKMFKEVKITNVQEQQMGQVKVSSFSIICKG